MKKITSRLALALFASLSVSLSAPASAAGKYQAVGDLNCAFIEGGAPNAVLCSFQSFSNKPVELYFALVDQPGINRTANVQWDVLALKSSGSFQKGGLTGDYLAGAAGLSAGSLYGDGKNSLILQARDGTIDSGISFFQLRPIE
jgi:hypothetical protein